MKQIVGFWGGPSNSQSAPVRSYVLYFERLAGWTEKGQVRGGACPGERFDGWTKGLSRDETRAVPDQDGAICFGVATRGRGHCANAGGGSARREHSEKHEAVLLVPVGKGGELDPRAFCGPSDAGASGVHSRAGRGGEVRGGRASARSRTDWRDGNHQRCVDGRGAEDCERRQDGTKRPSNGGDSS